MKSWYYGNKIDMAKISKEELREMRKQMFTQMEQRLQEMHPKEEDRMFNYHSSEFLIPAFFESLCFVKASRARAIAIPYQGILNLGDDTASVPEG